MALRLDSDYTYARAASAKRLAYGFRYHRNMSGQERMPKSSLLLEFPDIVFGNNRLRELEATRGSYPEDGTPCFHFNGG